MAENQRAEEQPHYVTAGWEGNMEEESSPRMFFSSRFRGDGSREEDVPAEHLQLVSHTQMTAKCFSLICSLSMKMLLQAAGLVSVMWLRDS